jgi:hypothetical protein
MLIPRNSDVLAFSFVTLWVQMSRSSVYLCFQWSSKCKWKS